jgi:hypothetical protein
MYNTSIHVKTRKGLCLGELAMSPTEQRSLSRSRCPAGATTGEIKVITPNGTAKPVTVFTVT